MNEKKFNNKLTRAQTFRAVMLFAVHTFVMVSIMLLVQYLNNGFSWDEFLHQVKEKNMVDRIIYNSVTVIIFNATSFVFLKVEKPSYLRRPRLLNMYFIIVECSLVIMQAFCALDMVYAMPFALGGLLTLVLIDRKTALFVSTKICLLMFIFNTFSTDSKVDFNNEFFTALVVGYSSGIMSLYLIGQCKSRIKTLIVGFVVSVPVISISIIINFDVFMQNPFYLLMQSLFSGVLSVTFMMGLLPFFERIFNVVTNYRLAELTDKEQSALLATLERKAVGTYNHSLDVARLAESCASAIGENPVLARACAYYHDVGKICQPIYFTENQAGQNPHDELTPELSTEIIRTHTINGMDVIKKNGLPKILADVALEHHGTLPIRYFYAKASQYTEGQLDITNFCYAGPKPQTKLSAIIMLADGSEAKVRSLKERSYENVDNAVGEIIKERLFLFPQFDECDITMREITIIRQTIVRCLSGVYHDRTAYPSISAYDKTIKDKIIN